MAGLEFARPAETSVQDSCRSMAALAILAKGSHEGMLILDGANREPAVTGFGCIGDVAVGEAQVVGVAGTVRCR